MSETKNACCPECSSEMRLEYGREGTTWFCSRCLKHHPACKAVHYMDRCMLLRGHGDLHFDGKHTRWDKDP